MKCVDLFSGCGGMSLGFSLAGFNILAAADIWDKAVEVYNQNFSEPCFGMDLSNLPNSEAFLKKYSPDMVIGGPPCQDFSSAGKRDESLGRADLTRSFSGLICRYKPKFFVMENVIRIKKSVILSEIITDLESEGYGMTSVILDASYCGAPQARKRFFLVGELGGNHNELLSYFKKNLDTSQMTMRDYFGDSLGLDYYYRHPRNYNRRGIYSLDEPSPTVRGVNRPLPPGYKKHKGDPKSANLNEIRPLTTIERSYIQTFPKDFKFEGTKTNLEQMIGNAVPVNLAKFVATCIKQFIDSKTTFDYRMESGLPLEMLIPERTLKS